VGPNALAGLADVLAAALLAWAAVAAWRHDAHNPALAAAATLVLAGGSWWAVADAAALAGNQTVAVIGRLAVFPGPAVMAGAFVCLAFSLTRPQWVPGRRLAVALLVEPVLISFAGLTNAWHLLVYRGAGAAHLVGSSGWTYGPLYWADTAYRLLAAVFAIAIIARAWLRSPRADRAARLAVVIAGVAFVGAYGVYRAGGFGQVPDPMPVSIALIATAMNVWVHRQDTFVFGPIARALIVDQIGDAVMVVSPGGRVLDLNLAAVTLVRGMNPAAPDRLAGTSVDEVFGDALALPTGPESELVVELAMGRVEFQVRASSLVDRHQRTLGTVYVARDVTEANAVVRRLGAAHAQLVRQVETIEKLQVDLVEAASRDPLTGLHNRRHLVEGFASMIATAQDTGETLAAVLFDVDRFKSINDEHGHLAGDAVLVELARRIRQSAPADALVARWGGEEYFVALPGADADTGFAFADDLRRRCEQEPIVIDGRTIRCTLSGGVSTYPGCGTTTDELFHCADELMYAAKNAGRNLVLVDTDAAATAARSTG
jgi:diguanylate cyclase (GGDEF)-like protein